MLGREKPHSAIVLSDEIGGQAGKLPVDEDVRNLTAAGTVHYSRVGQGINLTDITSHSIS
jgi:hypothetical protein